MAEGTDQLASSSAPSRPQRPPGEFGLLGIGFTKRKRDDLDVSSTQAAAESTHPAKQALKLQEAIRHADHQLQQYRLGRATQSSVDVNQNSEGAAAVEDVDADQEAAEPAGAAEEPADVHAWRPSITREPVIGIVLER